MIVSFPLSFFKCLNISTGTCEKRDLLIAVFCGVFVKNDGGGNEEGEGEAIEEGEEEADEVENLSHELELIRRFVICDLFCDGRFSIAEYS